MPENEGQQTDGNEDVDVKIAALSDEAQQLWRTLRMYKRRVLRNYLIPAGLIGGAFIQIFTFCYDCDIAEFWYYYAIGYWLAFPFVIYFFLRTRYRLGLKIHRASKQRRKIVAEIRRLYESSPGGNRGGLVM